MLDGIFDEARVLLENRLSILKVLSNFENKQWKEVRKQLIQDSLVEPQNVDRIGELMKVKGSISGVEEQLKKVRSLKK